MASANPKASALPPNYQVLLNLCGMFLATCQYEIDFIETGRTPKAWRPDRLSFYTSIRDACARTIAEAEGRI
jgi:hypothetical protein